MEIITVSIGLSSKGIVNCNLHDIFIVLHHFAIKVPKLQFKNAIDPEISNVIEEPKNTVIDVKSEVKTKINRKSFIKV